ncbi:MAG: peptide-binding protein [Candidatus Wallbacteria bacterium]|nr:peptide-binding protein [Candidatus Wallbacteria bacterium]
MILIAPGLKLLTVFLLFPVLLAATTDADPLYKALFEHYVLQDTASASADYKTFLNDSKKNRDSILEKAENSFNELLKNQTSEISQSPSYGDTIIESTIAETITLNPLLSTDDASTDVSYMIFDTLTNLGKNLELTPSLAASWEISSDCTVITFFLRKKVRWQDGVDFTAEDVRFTLEKILDPKVESPLRVYLTDLTDAATFETIDPYTIKISCRKPSPYLADWINPPIIPKHLFDKEDFGSSANNLHPVGTGPYRFVEWSKGEKIVLEANPDYFGGRPFLDRIIIKTIPDDSATLISLLRGDLDLMQLSPDQYFKQASSKEFLERFRVFTYPANSSYSFIGYNLNHPVLKDKKTRQALTLAINRREIVDKVLYSFGTLTCGDFAPSHWACNKSLIPYPFDPQAARKVLADAGWKDDDGDGILEQKGVKFNLEININVGNPVRKLIVEMVRDYWKTIGIETKINILEWEEYLKRSTEKNFQVHIGGWGLSNTHDPYGIWHSSQIPDKKNGFSGFNFISYNNPEADRLCELGHATMDREKLREIFCRLQAVIHEDQPYTFLYIPNEIWAVAKRIQGIEPAPAGIFYNFPHWYVPEELQKYK